MGISEDKLLILTTDAARYMLKAARALSTFYPQMLHVTCVCHALHRVAEEIRSKFPDIDQLISNSKKVKLFFNAKIIIFRYFLKLQKELRISKNCNQILHCHPSQ